MAQVVLITRDPVLAAGFPRIVEGQPGLKVLDVCERLNDLVTSPKAATVDVVLVDLDAGLAYEGFRELRRNHPKFKVVLWVNTIPLELAYQAMELGVRGILRRTLPPELQARCLRKVAEGELWFEKDLLQKFLTMRGTRLTPRESQLVSLLSQGLKNKEIAEALFLSNGTVKVYLSRLFKKLGVKDRFELALFGLKNVAADQASVRFEQQPEQAAGTDTVRSLPYREPFLVRRRSFRDSTDDNWTWQEP